MKTPWKYSVVVVLVSLAAAGCSKYYWTKPGGTAAEFDRDNVACARAALGLDESVPISAQAVKGAKFSEMAFRLCLAERGYRREQYASPPENAWRGFSDEN